MATLLRLGNVLVRMWPGDHLPPHVHVNTPEGEVCVDLLTGEAMGNKAALRASREALAWIETNRPALLLRWKEMNG